MEQMGLMLIIVMRTVSRMKFLIVILGLNLWQELPRKVHRLKSSSNYETTPAEVMEVPVLGVIPTIPAHNQLVKPEKKKRPRPKADNCPGQVLQKHTLHSSVPNSPMESGKRKHGRKSHPTQALPENEQVPEDEVDILQPEDGVNCLQPKDEVDVLQPKMNYCPGQNSEPNTPLRPKANNCPDKSFQKHPPLPSDSKSPLESSGRKHGRKSHPTQALPENERILEDEVDTLQPED